MPKNSSAASLPTQAEIRFLQLGFRLGQLLVACQSSGDDDPLAPLLPSLLDYAVVAAQRFRPEAITTSVEVAVAQSKDIWRRRFDLADEFGTAIPYEQIGRVILLAVSGIRDSLPAHSGPAILLRVGQILSQGTGSVDPDDLDAHTEWGYLDFDDEGPADELGRLTEDLGLTVEQLTGIPTDLTNFLQAVPDVDEILKRYPPNWWGWAFIESRIAKVLSGSHILTQNICPPAGIEPGYLNLIIGDDDTAPVRRVGISEEVSVTGTKRRLLQKYAAAGELGVLKGELVRTWSKLSRREAGNCAATINSHNSELRKCLKPLQLDVIAFGQGEDRRWRLAERSTGDE